MVLCQELLDADNLDQAFGMVWGQLSTNNYVRNICGDWAPDIKREIDMHFYVWETRNADEISAVEKIREQTEVAILDQIQNVATDRMSSAILSTGLSTAEERRAFCIYAAKSMSEDSGTIKSMTPNASRFLLDYLSAHPLSASEYRDRELITGCTKQGLNLGSDFDVISGFCDCTIGTLSGGMTDEEFDEYYEVINEQGTQVASKLPQREALIPQLEQCQKSEAF